MNGLQLDNFLVVLDNEISQLTNHFVFDGYSALASLLKAPLGAMIVLYIILTGYAIARGIIEKPQQELMKFCIKAGLIYMAAMNWDWFAIHVRDLFVVGSETIAAKLMHAINKQSTGSINQELQNVLNEILTLGISLFKEASLRKLAPYYAGIMVFLSGSITIGLAFIEIIIAKLMLAVTLCNAPLFILFTLFNQTKSFFERWLGVLSGFAFVLIFVSSVIGLCIHLMHRVTSAFLDHPDALTSGVWVPIFIVAILCVLGIKQAASIGKSIGGSVCTSNGTAMVGDMIRSSLGAWGLSKTIMSKAVGAASSTLDKGKRASALTHNLSKQMQKNIRGGAS